MLHRPSPVDSSESVVPVWMSERKKTGYTVYSQHSGHKLVRVKAHRSPTPTKRSMTTIGEAISRSFHLKIEADRLQWWFR